MLDVLGEVWIHPINAEQRLGQFLMNVVRSHTLNMSREDIEPAVWAINDDTLLEMLVAEQQRLALVLTHRPRAFSPKALHDP